VGVALVVVAGSGSVEVSEGEIMVADELPVGLSLVGVLVVRCRDDVVVVEVVMNKGADGPVEPSDVCSTAYTITITANTPATPAATITPRRSYHSAVSGSSDGCSSVTAMSARAKSKSRGKMVGHLRLVKCLEWKPRS
jgi:hypothetical protein